MLTYEKVVKMKENYNIPIALNNGLILFGEWDKENKFFFTAKKGNKFVSLCYPCYGPEKMKRFLETMNRF